MNFETIRLLSKNIFKSFNENDSFYHYGVLPRVAYSFSTYPDGSNLIKNSIYQSIKPCITEFLDYILDLNAAQEEFFDTIFLFFPIVVFSGAMFEYIYNNQSGELKPTKHVILQFKDAFKKGSSGNTYYIDFVRADYLQEFLESQINEIIKIIDIINLDSYEVDPIPISYLKNKLLS